MNTEMKFSVLKIDRKPFMVEVFICPLVIFGDMERLDCAVTKRKVQQNLFST